MRIDISASRAAYERSRLMVPAWVPRSIRVGRTPTDIAWIASASEAAEVYRRTGAPTLVERRDGSVVAGRVDGLFSLNDADGGCAAVLRIETGSGPIVLDAIEVVRLRPDEEDDCL